MKTNDLLILFLFFLISCNQNKSSVIDLTNKECREGVEIAKAKINKGFLIYCSEYGDFLNFSETRHENELDSLLSRLKIKRESTWYSDVENEFKKSNCYCEIMNDNIKEKFGKDFIDSIHYAADSLWILKNTDLVFNGENGNGEYDRPALFPGDKFYDEMNHSGLQDKFDQVVNYPKDYIKTEQHKDGEVKGIVLLRLDISVDKAGKAKLNDYFFTFVNLQNNTENYNQSSRPYLLKIAKDLVENTKWIPAKIKGVSVNSEFSAILNLE